MFRVKLPYIFLCLVCYAMLVTCAKEYSYESNRAIGSLRDDSTNNCFPKTISGIYYVNSDLIKDNYVQVEVQVDKPGTYTIYTDTVNGYYFQTSGIFSTTGLNTVNLEGFGKPLQYGTDNFTVFFDTSTCNFFISIKDTTTQPSQYAFLGSNCMVDSLLGFYIKGVPVSDTARLSFPVDVKSPGSYKIYTDTVNGYSFSATGMFTTIGPQNVTLRCYGTPQNIGTDMFQVFADSTTCSFTAPVLSPVVPIVNEHFPLIRNNYWSYNDIKTPGDTVLRSDDNIVSLNNETYHVFTEQDENMLTTKSYFRESDNYYYEYCSGDKYTNNVKFQSPVNNELLFLKEDVQPGSQWKSAEFTGTSAGGKQVSVQYSFNCLDNNSYYIINNVAFSNVYIIQMRPMVRSQSGAYAFTGEEIDTYYARGIGIIYQQFFSEDDSSVKLQLRAWRIY